MKPTLYLYRSCTSCRNAASILEHQGVDFEAREFFKEPFTREELETVLEKAGMTPSELVATRSTVYRSEKMGEQSLSDEDFLQRMLGEPRLVRRPILVTDHGVTIGFNRARFDEIARQLSAEESA